MTLCLKSVNSGLGITTKFANANLEKVEKTTSFKFKNYKIIKDVSKRVGYFFKSNWLCFFACYNELKIE